MANVKVFTQTDFAGGENDLLPPHLLGGNEAAKLTNLIPAHDGSPLASRDGITKAATVGDGTKPVTGYTIFKLQAGSYWHIASTDAAVYQSVNGVDFTLLHTWPTTGHVTRYAVLMDRLFMSNGIDPIQTWDGVTKTAVTDRAANGPTFPLMMTFRDRLWLAGKGSTVMYCGSSDQAELKPNSTTEYYKRWQDWSGSAVNNGGSLVIGADDGTIVTAIGYMYNGVVIFKERSTYIWMYGDADIPKIEGKVEILVPGVGCASADTICYLNGVMYFLGQAVDGSYSVYKLAGQGVDDPSIKIPNAMARVIVNSANKPRAVVRDHYYMLSADDTSTPGNERTMTYCYDLRRNCWFEFSGWSVGSLCVEPASGYLRIGSGKDGSVYDYPVGDTDDGTPIDWHIQTRIVDGGDPTRDHRWRSNILGLRGDGGRIEVGVRYDGGSETKNVVTINPQGVLMWDSASQFWDHTPAIWYDGALEHVIDIPLSKRARTAQFSIRGNKPVKIDRFSVAFRDRQVAYY